MGFFDYVSRLNDQRNQSATGAQQAGLTALDSYKKAIVKAGSTAFGNITTGFNDTLATPAGTGGGGDNGDINAQQLWDYIGSGRMDPGLTIDGLGKLTPQARRGLWGILHAFGDARWTSGWRSPTDNAEAGGTPDSPHQRGISTDIVVYSGNYQPLVDWAQAHGGTTLVHDAGSGTHLHVNWN